MSCYKRLISGVLHLRQLPYNPRAVTTRFHFSILLTLLTLLNACSPDAIPSAEIRVPEIESFDENIPPGFAYADGTRSLTFPADFGAHPDFRTEWWYYTGNLETDGGRHFGFELTIFRAGLLPPTSELPDDSEWYDTSLYFAHFALSDIASDKFHAFERYTRPGPGLAGALGHPYRVWLEDWSISEQSLGAYRLAAAQSGIALNLTLTDELGVVLHGQYGYSRKGKNITNASYYYSQPRLRAKGTVELDGVSYAVSGLAWKDHEFSTSVLDENQIGWDWFSLQFEDGSALMLFQLRESTGRLSDSSSGAFIHMNKMTASLKKDGFKITILDEWRSPHTGGVYPSEWQIQINEPDCLLDVRPWMADQEIHFPAFTYWEGAVRFEGTCNGIPTGGNGYVELTGYAGHLPLP